MIKKTRFRSFLLAGIILSVFFCSSGGYGMSGPGGCGVKHPHPGLAKAAVCLTAVSPALRAIPEPKSFVLIGIGLLIVIGWHKKHHSKKIV